MSEGLFTLAEYEFPDNFPVEKVLFSAVKVIPRRRLIFDVFENEQDRVKWSTGFESDELISSLFFDKLKLI